MTAAAVLSLLAACGSVESAEQPPRSAPSIPQVATFAPTATQPPTPLPTEATPSPTTAPALATEAAALDGFGLAHHRFAIPKGLFIEAVATGQDDIVSGTVVSGTTDSGDVLLWSPAEPFATATMIADLFPDQTFAPVVTDLVHYNGTFVAFVMGDELARDRHPTILTSGDGVSWQRTDMSPMVQNIAFITGFTRSASASPPSPPYPGASGVTDALVDSGVVQATGWASIDGEVVAMVWRFDGATWTEERLPNQSGFTEYGSQITSSPVGELIDLGSIYYSGAGVLLAEGPHGWQPIDRDGEVFTSVAANDGYLYRLERRPSDDPTVVWWSETGDEWSSVPLPVGDNIDPMGWNIEASAWHDPIFWQSAGGRVGDAEPSVHIWTLDRQRWIQRSALGTRVIGADATMLATHDEASLYIYDRRWPPE